MIPQFDSNKEHKSDFLHEHELKKLNKLIVERGKHLVGINGGPGMGKTILAHKFIHELSEYFDGGISCVSTHSLPISSENLVFDKKRNHLLVIDEVYDSAEILLSERILPETVVDEVYRCKTLHTIVISRKRVEWIPIDATIHVNELSKVDAVEFIKNIVGNKYEYISDSAIDMINGSPLVANLLGAMAVEKGISVDELLSKILPFELSGLVDTLGRPLRLSGRLSKVIVADARAANEELLRIISKDRNYIYSISPRRFEELAADVFERLGYTVEITPPSKDGGKDLYVARKSELGSLLFYVECKRYAPDRPVGVGLVRSLYGVVEAGKATAGLMLTTSHFTKGAHEFQRHVERRLTLSDYTDFQSWLRCAGFVE
jgi:restriction system protein